ncbi:MAG: GtrA family protein [Oscillospiraceae bacterium]|jgi:putative flippase GtrA|nr:GtrA family protein [Oscillospiraceae bacterium]
MADKNIQGQTEFSTKENLWLTVKYFLIAASAGAIQLGSFSLLRLFVFNEAEESYGWSYFISLVLSVIWNFTINRRYTFKSTANVSRAMILVFAYYVVFTPVSLLGGRAIVNASGKAEWVDFLVMIATLLINGVTEYLYQRVVIYRGTINTNDLAQKDKSTQDGQE